MRNIAATVLAVALTGAMAAAQCAVVESDASARPATPDMTVEVGKVALGDVTSERTLINVELVIKSKRSLKLTQINLSNLRLNGIPVYADAIQDRIELDSDKPVTLKKPLAVAVFYRDLATLKPLEMAVGDKQIVLEGDATVDLELGGLAAAVMHTRTPRITTSFQQQVPLEIPGGFLVQSGALMLIKAASGAMEQIKSGVAMLSPETWRAQVLREYAPNLFLGYSRFTIEEKGKPPVTWECSAGALRISKSLIVLPKELLEPWKFEPEVVAGLKKKHIKVDESSFDLWLFPANAHVRNDKDELDPAEALRVSQNQVKVLTVPADEFDSVLLSQEKGRPQTISVHRRNSAAGLALVEIVQPGEAAINVHFDLGEQPAWENIAVFRFPEGARARFARPDVIFVAGTREGTRIRLKTPVDSSAWGAPLATPDGVLGLVQDQETAIGLDETWKTLKIEDPPLKRPVEVPPQPGNN